MKELIPEIERRRALRALADAQVPDEAVNRILTAGTYAPSCTNNQPWRFLALRDNELLPEVKEHLYAHPIAGFDPLKVKAALKIPADVTLVTLIVFGYPGDLNALSEKHQESERSKRTRKPYNEVVSSGRWPDSWR